MTINLDNLRKIAEDAQGVLPEPWIVMETKTMHVAVVERSKRDGSIISGGKVAEAGHMAFRDHIVTFDPPTVLALLSRLEQAEQALQRVREVIHEYDPDCLTCMCNSDGDCCKCTVADFQEALDGHTRG